MWLYLYDLKLAILMFPFAALIFTFPFLWWHYYRHGAISRWTILMEYSFVLYMMCAYFLVNFPLPPREYVAKLTTATMNLIPFHFVSDIIKSSPLKITEPSTYLKALTNSAVIQPIFNIFLTMPFGIYMRSYFKKGLKTTILLSFLLSLFFELTQLSGLYGLYPRPYRLFDVDDLMMNTLGGFVGFYVTRFVMRWVPSEAHLKESLRIRAKHVSLFRHATAFGVDWVLLLLIRTAITVLLPQIPRLLGSLSPLIVFGEWLVLMLIPELLFKRTLGMQTVHLQIESNGSSGIILRNILGYSMFVVLVAEKILRNLLWNNPAMNHQVQVLFAFAAVIYFGVVIVDLLVDIFRPSHELFFEKLSRTKLISTFDQ
ncbi:VanZ family protein [Paucilactobacillus suebicus]|uniref:VanZ family protein n=1 Tax=Paucilactobacillus suebicus DSM 5007 = KCTC 3549 TaxID=1423807 RepID=A0A0R1VXV5_9LACO|nr:VanZ family protein [Paucilactobacillus suebicus]KRM10510.1 VanZ family protein [Paucilactobacillus suebicus DSM 5007 = KCTC 3549]